CGGGISKGLRREWGVLQRRVFPLVAGGCLLDCSIWSRPGMWTPEFSVVAGAAVYVLGHLLGWASAKIVCRAEPKSVPPFLNVLWALPAGIFAGYEVYGLSCLAYYWKSSMYADTGLWHAASWGTPLVVVAFLLAGTVHT